MKLWLKYLIGIVLGIAFSLILPFNSAGVNKGLAFITDIVIRFGRYIVVPLLFFTAMTSINKLRDTRMILKTGIWALIIIIVSALILTLIGLISILIIKLPRIPITVDKTTDTAVLNLADMVRALFPSSAFDTLNNGSLLLASFLFACFAGGACTGDQITFKPIITLADSLSKLCYNIATLFTEVLAIGMVAVMCSWTIQFRSILTGGTFLPLILMLTCDFIITAFGIYPAILYYVCHDPHPFRVLYASSCSIIAAFFSGDSNLTLPINIRTGKESLGIRRRINGITYPLFSIFARGGAALVTTVSFVVIWRSYANLSIPFSDILWIMFMAFMLSFLLGGFPSGGPFIALTVLCTMYGRGFETGYLLLKPAASIICSFGAAFDVLTAMFGSYIVGVKTKMIEHHSIQHFI
ncbi:MAG: cation:dicarboxylase symporter family transporter [Treponema sp.]|nr:cation:dicarboxylase symporter family transporter [Treponema sp.]